MTSAVGAQLAAGHGPLGGHLVHVVPIALPVLGAAWLLLPDAVRSLRRRVKERRVAAPLVSRDAVHLAAAASAVAALVHLRVMPEHFRESWMYGTFFLGAALSQLGFAGWLVARPTRTLLRIGIGGNVAIVVLWAVTRTVGVPLGPGQGATEGIGELDLVATISEAVLVGAAVMALRPHRRPRASSPARGVTGSPEPAPSR